MNKQERIISRNERSKICRHDFRTALNRISINRYQCPDCKAYYTLNFHGKLIPDNQTK